MDSERESGKSVQISLNDDGDIVSSIPMNHIEMLEHYHLPNLPRG